MLSITASIIQGSATVSATYVVTAADLRTVFCNSILKYADDTYLIIPGMLSPRHGLGLEAQKTGLGLVITGVGLGLMIVVASALPSLASWPRSF